MKEMKNHIYYIIIILLKMQIDSKRENRFLYLGK